MADWLLGWLEDCYAGLTTWNQNHSENEVIKLSVLSTLLTYKRKRYIIGAHSCRTIQQSLWHTLISILSYFSNIFRSFKLSSSHITCRLYLSAVPEHKNHTHSDVAKLQPQYVHIIITVRTVPTKSCLFSVSVIYLLNSSVKSLQILFTFHTVELHLKYMHCLLFRTLHCTPHCYSYDIIW